MKTLVISRPVYEHIMPLVEFPKDGDNFYIEKTIDSLCNIGSIVAITHAKYGVDVSFTGMIGEDHIGNKVKEILNEYKIDTTYIETSYTEKTCKAYKIYNSKTNQFTNVNEVCLKNNLTKYKYEFIPEVVIMDDKDYPANLAAINNYKDAKFIFIGERFNKESLVYCQKCNYVICDIRFASGVTGVVNDLTKSKNIITLFQKYIDIYNSNLIIKLDNYDFLYCVDDEVRIIKNINNNIKNKDNVYFAVLSYFLSLNIDIETSIKLTNKVMLSSNNELDMIKNIPDYKIISDTINDYNKYISEMNPSNLSNNNLSNVNEIKNNQATQQTIKNQQNNTQINDIIVNSENIPNPNLMQNNVQNNTELNSQYSVANSNISEVNNSINSNNVNTNPNINNVQTSNVQTNTILNNNQQNINNGVNNVEGL